MVRAEAFEPPRKQESESQTFHITATAADVEWIDGIRAALSLASPTAEVDEPGAALMRKPPTKSALPPIPLPDDIREGLKVQQQRAIVVHMALASADFMLRRYVCSRSLQASDVRIHGNYAQFSILLYGPLSNCLLYTSPSPRDRTRSRMPSSA